MKLDSELSKLEVTAPKEALGNQEKLRQTDKEKLVARLDRNVEELQGKFARAATKFDATSEQILAENIAVQESLSTMTKAIEEEQKRSRDLWESVKRTQKSFEDEFQEIRES